MVVCSTRPLLVAATKLIEVISRQLPLNANLGFYATALTVGPLLGSLITEPAAMTVTLLRGRPFDAMMHQRRFVETVQWAMFLRDQPDQCKSFLEHEKTKFEEVIDKRRQWWGSSGKKQCAVEVPRFVSMFELTSDILHSSFRSLAAIVSIKVQEGPDALRTVTNDIHFQQVGAEKGGFKNIVLHYFSHLDLHVQGIRWWLMHSRAEFLLPENFQSYWNEKQSSLKSRIDSLRPQFTDLHF